MRILAVIGVPSADLATNYHWLHFSMFAVWPKNSYSQKVNIFRLVFKVARVLADSSQE